VLFQTDYTIYTLPNKLAESEFLKIMELL